MIQIWRLTHPLYSYDRPTTFRDLDDHESIPVLDLLAASLQGNKLSETANVQLPQVSHLANRSWRPKR